MGLFLFYKNFVRIVPMNFQKILSWGIKILLLATALTPLIVSDYLYFFPFVFGKAVFYRSIIEIALVLFVIYLLVQSYKNNQESEIGNWKFLKHPLFLFTFLFFVSAGVSSFLAPNAYRAFFGDMQRGEGFFGLIHYFIFLFIALVIFQKKDWLNFFKISLVVALISNFYAWLQYFQVVKFPFALAPAGQPGSFSGNAAFLASYLIFIFGFAFLVFRDSAQKSFWRYFAVFISIASFLTIFITAIRGAILGTAFGSLFLFGYFAFRGFESTLFSKKRMQMLAAGLLIALITFSFVFWLTMSAEFWLKAPGIRRLTSVSLENPSVITRLLALKVSWSAFKEKPILGWGMENYGVAYNKHYDPAYSFYAEDWFDRAHNRIADIAVMQGVLGLLSYFGVLGLMFYLAPPFLMAVFIAYFIQNLFLFDQLTSYIPFFALAGFLIINSPEMGEKFGVLRLNFDKIGSKLKLALWPIAAIITIAVFYSLYSYNYVPVYQARNFKQAMKLKVGEKILVASDSFLKPYNFMQMEIRTKFVEIMYNSKLVSKKQFASLVDKGLDSLEEVTEKEPFDPRNFSLLMESYNERAKEDASIFKKTEVFAQKAVELSPKKQGLLFLLSFILSGQGRYEESIKIVRQVLALDERVAKSHYELAVTLLLAADSELYKETPKRWEYRAEAEKELDLAREWGRKKLGSLETYSGSDLSSTQYYLFLESDLKNMAVLYRSLGKPDKMVDILEVLLYFYPNNKDYRYDAVIIYRALRNKKGIIRHAEELKKLDSSLANDMDIVIDLAKKENWEILDTL